MDQYSPRPGSDHYEIDHDEAAHAPDAGAPAFSAIDPVFARDKFLLKQKLMTISQKYDVSDEQGNKILFVLRPAHTARSLLAIFAALIAFFVVCGGFIALANLLASGRKNEAFFAVLMVIGFVGGFIAAIFVAVVICPKRHVTFFRDQSMTEALLYVLQDKKFAFLNVTYSIMAVDGAPLAVLHKNYLSDLFRKKWTCKDDQGRIICIIREDSALKAFLRRFIGGIIGAMLRTNFIINDPTTGTLLGTFNRKFTILDRYVLDMSPDRQPSGQSTLDRRIALAIGVMLDTAGKR